MSCALSCLQVLLCFFCCVLPRLWFPLLPSLCLYHMLCLLSSSARSQIKSRFLWETPTHFLWETPYSLSTLSCFAWLIVHPGYIDHELWGGRNSVPAFLSISLLPNAWHLEGVCEPRGREGACLPQGTLAPSSRWIIGVFHYIEGWMFHSPLWGQRVPLRSSFPEAQYTSNDYQVLLEVLSLPSSRQDPLWTVKQLILL